MTPRDREAPQLTSPPWTSPLVRPPIGVAIIGYGYWGPNLVRTFRQGCECPVWICETDRQRRAAAQAAWPDVPVLANLADVWQEPAIGAVVVATPTTTHGPLCTAALQAGKHVLCEKPLAPDSATCRELGQLAERLQRVLMTGFIYLFHPAFHCVRKIIQQQRLGDLQLITAERTNWGPVRSDVDAAVDLATHDLSMLVRLFGLPSVLSAQGANCLRPTLADAVHLWLQFPSGLQARLWASWLHPEKTRKLTCIGSQGVLLWDELHPSKAVRLFRIEAEDSPRSPEVPRFDMPSVTATSTNAKPVAQAPRLSGAEELEYPASEPLLDECRSFLAACRGEHPPVGDTLLATRVALVLEATARSFHRRGSEVPVEPL